MTQSFSVTKARAQFPALQQSHQIYFDNAGGSQVLSTVSSSIKSYLEETNVQLGASYNVAKQSTEIHEKGLAAAASFMNAGPDEVVIGPSTTQLFSNLSLILSLPPSSTLILSSLDHEANISAWLRLATLQNHTIKWWKPSPTTTSQPPTSPLLTPDNLRPLLDEKTALVTCTHASNVLGSVHDIRGIAEEVHKVKGARLCVDGVAYAPHGEVDVKALGVDFYSFSWYKVYGPHISILYASRSAQRTLSSLGHYFHTGTSLTTKLGLASASYELVAAIPSIITYFGPEKKKFWEAVAEHEERLQEILLGYLRGREDVTVWGMREGGRKLRVPVISFTVKGRGNREIVEKIEGRSNFGCRWGHFYSKRLVEEVLGLGEEGVVRVSLVHYNTEEEVIEYVKVLDEVLAEK